MTRVEDSDGRDGQGFAQPNGNRRKLKRKLRKDNDVERDRDADGDDDIQVELTKDNDIDQTQIRQHKTLKKLDDKDMDDEVDDLF
eukprot:CAMPEP_0116898410 /NCGR_PEP_ID=MMETSP0467-20121206/7132_1 /TAXON_ID=283647 /ORGANISM="Mesodinium pulex, Strain SPMC105" /LENGTH=84 /DNA_ID=CAMNT_0004570509 /DNA_START=1595 /DNA_END=1852 /DNA_ORIENTATION=+